MNERRGSVREKSFLGGTLAFDPRFAIADCLVRDLSREGARIDLPASVPLAQDVDFTIDRKGLRTRARVVWRNATTIGLSFVDGPAQSRDGNVIPIGTAQLIRKLQAANEDLRRRLSEAR